MENDRVKFYSATDLSCRNNLMIAEQVIQRFDGTKVYDDVNEIIELYNIKCFFDHGLMKSWAAEKEDEYINIVRRFDSQIGKYFSRISDMNFLSVFEAVDITYTENFWYLLDSHKSYKHISPLVFKTSFSSGNFVLYEVLWQKQLVQHYGNALKELFLSDCVNAELLLAKYVVQQDRGTMTLYFPSEITKTEMEDIVIRYIESDNPNPNYLNLIFHGSKEFSFLNTTKLAAKRKYINTVERHSDSGGRFEYSIEVTFSDDQLEEKRIEYQNNRLIATYSTKWIKENRDSPTLLNNFIYLFDFTDLQYRSQLVHQVHMLTFTERFLNIKGRNQYFTCIKFNQLQSLSRLQMIAYRRCLQENHIRLEDVFTWFFMDYLKNEFDVEGFLVSMPSGEASFLEKCRSTASEIESILKQFKLFCEYKTIDHDLMQISSDPLLFKDVPSLLNRKYIYGKGDIYKSAVQYFFSDQTMLSYIPRLNKTYHCFYDLLCHEEVYLDDYHRFKFDVTWLQENGFLQIENGRKIKMHAGRVMTLKQLYEHGTLRTTYLYKLRESVKWMEKHDMIEYGSTLFSKPEQDYLNYLMNRSEFINGLELRNRYLHGTQSHNENEHELNYSIFLSVLALIIIKINEEFCLSEEWIKKDE